MEITGKIKVITPITKVSASFKKCELVVSTEEQYPQYIQIDFVQDKTDLLNGFHPGEQVKISINLRGREWVNPQGETKYFNSIQGWRIEKIQGSTTYQAPPPMPPQSAVDKYMNNNNFKEEDHDDLPF